MKNSLRARRINPSQEKGVTIVENLIAITLLTLVLAGNSKLIISSIHATSNARNFAALATEVHELVDGYRTDTYTDLLSRFGGSYSGIANGDTATEEVSSPDTRTTFTTTFTAIKSSNTAFPEAVRVRVEAVQRRGKFENSSYDFETIVAQTRS